jgi:hypothetical protein
MALQTRQAQSVNPTATREDMGGGRRAAGLEARRPLERADPSQPLRPVGHRPERMPGPSPEAPLRQGC